MITKLTKTQFRGIMFDQLEEKFRETNWYKTKGEAVKAVEELIIVYCILFDVEFSDGRFIMASVESKKVKV